VAVPLWAQIMKVATAGDEPAWLQRPEGIIAVPVCRVSGRLPGEGCSTVEVMRNDGHVEVRSMVISEYFARGTAPDGICDMHPAPSWFQRVAEVFGADGREPARESELALPPPVAAPPAPQTGASASVVEPPPHPPAAEQQPRVEEKPKKRGFWGRLFGRRDKDDDRRPREKQPERDERQPSDRQPPR
jgi:hypothetical protein